MTDAQLFIVVSGIPASGKSTLAKRIGEAMSIPVLDKDEILEALSDSLGVGDMVWRTRLSRASDSVLERLALSFQSAVVCSFWRHPLMAQASGTPIEWLTASGHKVVEVYCDCAPAIAHARFRARERHPGHLDLERDPSELRNQLTRLYSGGGLRVSKLVEIKTEGEPDIDRVVAQIFDELGAR